MDIIQVLQAYKDELENLNNIETLPLIESVEDLITKIAEFEERYGYTI